MLKRTLAKIIERQGERLVKLENERDDLRERSLYTNKKCLNLQGQLDDSIDERLEDLKTIESHLTRNDYGNPQAKIAIALEFVEAKIKELSNT